MGTGIAFLSVVALHREARVVGTAWMVLGVAGYVVWRRRQGLDPRKRYRVRSEERPPDFLELSYKSALVPIFGAAVDVDAMRRAAAVVDRGAAVEALYVLQVPADQELRDGLEEEEYEARCALDVARLQAKARGLKVRVKLVRTRNPGAAIVCEARERGSDLIYLSTEHAPSEERLLGPTTRYVLAKRPCRVIVEGGPEFNGTGPRRRSVLSAVGERGERPASRSGIAPRPAEAAHAPAARSDRAALVDEAAEEEKVAGVVGGRGPQGEAP